MKVLIVSDTHGRSDNLERVLQRERPFDAMIHCGDVEDGEAMIRSMARCPVYMVRGNNDYFTDLPDDIEIVLGGCRIMVSHGHRYRVYLDYGQIWEEGHSREVRVIAFGHIHRPVLKNKGGITLVNPGSLSYPRQQGRRPTYIVMEIGGNGEPEFRTCEL